MGKARFAIAVIAIALYVGSLFLPGYTSYEHQSGGATIDATAATVSMGYAVLEIGWIGILGLVIAWYGNVLFIFALGALLFKSAKSASLFSLLALLVGLTAFQLLWTTIPADEGGVMVQQITSFDVGYYVWLLSFALIAVYSYAYWKPRNADQSPISPNR